MVVQDTSVEPVEAHDGIKGRTPVEEATRIGLEVLHTVLRHTPDEQFQFTT
jgi:hypothetical protein